MLPQTMYTSFVLSSILYACTVWGGTYESDISKLEKIQMDGMRLITGATAKSNREALYRDTNFIPMKSRVKNSMLVVMYKILKGLCPTYLSNLVSVNDVSQALYNFRTQAPTNVPWARLESFKGSFVPHTYRLWNDLPDNVQNASPVHNFKQLLYLDDNIPNTAYYYGQRWPSVHHARLRIGCRALNDDLSSNLHVIPSSACQRGYPIENAQHYFYHCPSYQVERVILLNSIQHIPDLSVKTILFGNPQLSLRDNHELFQAVHTYIMSTKRFR